MKILLTAIGTRGDVEPFLAIGEILKANGHDVICLFPEQFRDLALDSDLRFVGLGTEFMDMLDSKTGKMALGGASSWWQKMMAYYKLAKIQSTSAKKMFIIQHEVITQEKPDRIVHNGKAIYPVVWEIENKNKTIFVSPVPFLHYVKGTAHLVFNRNLGTVVNKLTYRLADWGLFKTVWHSMKWINVTGIKKRQIKEVLKHHKVIYTISPTLFPRPDYWPSNLKVLGYHERNKTTKWTPSENLLTFLSKNTSPIFITFGSMTNPEPESKTAMFLDILVQHNIPAIINMAEGGLKEPDKYNRELIHFVNRIPYDWIFPKVYAVIHHGGSGTTHTGLKYGCPTLIIPHIIDQFLWNKIIFKIGAGPLGIKINNMTKKNLEPKILNLINNPMYKSKAHEIGDEIRNENFKETLYREIIDS